VKPRWVLVLLVVSLAGNVVELGVYARAEWRRHREMQKFFKRVQSGAVQWNQQVLVRELEPKMRELNRRQSRWASELNWQDYQQPPDSAVDRQALDSVASFTRQRYELMYESRRALPAVEDAKLRRRMERRWREQMDIGD